ncbi:MAG: efflux RND transporter periplasmic adaptor subunit [Gammaproteobacteria bacterium]
MRACPTRIGSDPLRTTCTAGRGQQHGCCAGWRDRAPASTRSRAKAKSRACLALAHANFAREQTLWQKKISAELDYLRVKGQLAEARIEQRAAEHELHALGFDLNQLRRLERDPSESLSRYEIIAPFAGTIIDKHISLGEALEANATAFLIADLSTVWVDLSIAPNDLSLVAPGSPFVVSSGYGPPAQGYISYVQPLVNEETRTVLVRGVLANTNGRWRPGLFVTGLNRSDRGAAHHPPLGGADYRGREHRLRRDFGRLRATSGYDRSVQRSSSGGHRGSPSGRALCRPWRLRSQSRIF